MVPETVLRRKISDKTDAGDKSSDGPSVRSVVDVTSTKALEGFFLRVLQHHDYLFIYNVSCFKLT